MVSTVDRQRLESFKRKVTRLRKAAGPAADDGLVMAAEIITAEQKRLAPEVSGALKASIQYKLTVGGKTGNRAVRIFTDDFKARWVEFGTAPHRIEAVNAPALALQGGIFVESVDHPGATATPFFFPGFRASRKRARAAINKGIRASVKKAVA